MLWGSGYEWRRCVNGEIPIGAVSLSQKNTKPVFIGRGDSGRQRRPHVAPIYISGKMYVPEYQRYNWVLFDNDLCELSEFEILVANNVKNRERYSGYSNTQVKKIVVIEPFSSSLP